MTGADACPRCGRTLPTTSSFCPHCASVAAESAAMHDDLATTVDHVVSPRSVGGLAAARADSPPTVVPPPGRSGPAEPDMPEPGQRYGGYQIIRTLGRGGMGAVFEAEQIESHRRVALKLLSRALDSEDARRRFFREGRLAASINHPHTVYVYGTEEVCGRPAISMELVAGGTLQQRVQREGPLPVAEAVDAMLQVVEGLEAALALGVLHRDVKPSNCFVDGTGKVKVGDFGLSVSTEVRAETQLTQSGAFLGTPAYASPEQLRGDELDQRSDIYAVGVTLYYLLTGKMPFDAPSMIKLLAIVLEQPAPAPVLLRPDLPQELNEVVLRCLEKQPAQRFRDYRELRAALRSFGTETLIPAPLSLRFAAGAIDFLVLIVLATLISGAGFLLGIQAPVERWLGDASATAWALLSLVGVNLYYAVLEGRWGASPGKRLCALRLINRRRGAPGVWRASLRAAVLQVVPRLPIWLGLGFGFAPEDPFTISLRTFLLQISVFPAFGAMFLNARNRNGYSALHDRISRTRVVLRTEYVDRPGLDLSETTHDLQPTTDKIGPYHVLERLDGASGDPWLVAFDARLLRKVWIRRSTADAPSWPAKLTQLARPGRLRWLGGDRPATGGWDAFEAVPGKPLVALLDRPQSWARVRHWLHDLSEELAAALADDTVPEQLDLDRVWIAADGRAKLFDVPAPGARPSEPASDASSSEDAPTHDDEPAQRRKIATFLHQFAVATLSGARLTGEQAARLQVARPLPLAVLPLLDGLRHCVEPREVVQRLQPLLHQRAEVTRARRAVLVVGCGIAPLLIALIPSTIIFVVQYWNARMPEVRELQQCLDVHSPMRPPSAALTDVQREALEVYIASRFGSTLRNERVWNSLYSQAVFPDWQRQVAESIRTQRREISQDARRQAESIVLPLLAERRRPHPFEEIPVVPVFVFFFLGAMLLTVAVPAAITAPLFGGGLTQLIAGIELATIAGRPASAGRLFGRSLLVAAPVIVALVAAFFLVPRLGGTVACLGVLSVYGILVLVSTLLPHRGLADRCAGTYPVPR